MRQRRTKRGQLRRKQTIGRNRKEVKEICRPEGEGEEYVSVGEDGRPCIKWRKLRTTNSVGRENETMEKREEGEIGREEEVKAKEYRDADSECLIREYQKNAKPTHATMKLLEFYGGEK